jgi:hypothetical protein
MRTLKNKAEFIADRNGSQFFLYPVRFVSIIIIIFSLFLITQCMSDKTGKSEPGTPAFHSWASTPPLGWNSWDCYGPTVVEDEVKANADYMAKYMKKTGWQYIVVDIRWYVGNDRAGGYNQDDPEYTIDEYGRFTPALNRFHSASEGKVLSLLLLYS